MSDFENYDKELKELEKLATDGIKYFLKLKETINSIQSKKNINDRILFLRNKGLTYKEIAQEVDLNATTVYRKCKQLGLYDKGE